MKISDLSIQESFGGKTVLLIGGSGFIGKVWLSMLVDYIPNIKKIYILVRPSKGKEGNIRFTEMYSKCPAFLKLHQKYGNNLADLKIVEAITGDICSVKLGLNKIIQAKLIDEVDLVVNFAADLRFIAPLDQMLQTNTGGAVNISDFILSTKKAKLLHVSTCYVAGMADGLVSEKLSKNISPNGVQFSAQDEYNWGMQESLGARSRSATDKELKLIGSLRAERLGWPNTYTYTKALGEILLSQKLPRDRLCIFRPSIVESAEKYPFPGWNEDFNGTAPFIQMLSSRYRLLVAKPNHNLDIIPVDYVARGLTIAGSALLSQKHLEIYHSSTSALNPLSVALATDYICKYYKTFERKRLEGFLLPYPKTKFISPKHIFSGPSLTKIEKTVTFLLDKIKLEKNSSRILSKFGINSKIESIKRKAKAIDVIAKVYKPFIYDYNYTFKSENLMAHKVVEKEFSYNPTEINWDRYWREIHIPGLNRWCLPQLKSLSSKKKELT
ncbi:SDR family oxidoreductase [Fluviispira multicolorata]|uniref:Thioester reductase (TE) domain-containing protein n=1 Tax=Fluviispira multicolorata TaxID=2654512 RepID=A0A833N2Y1_9BACT|nr:SDR family oxidoreductase [Fluviispira multicolorata]KAB8029090.1 hypothetical protein GCL57_11155 [Fluviispira multicolorata]